MYLHGRRRAWTSFWFYMNPFFLSFLFILPMYIPPWYSESKHVPPHDPIITCTPYFHVVPIQPGLDIPHRIAVHTNQLCTYHRTFRKDACDIRQPIRGGDCEPNRTISILDKRDVFDHSFQTAERCKLSGKVTSVVDRQESSR